MSDEPSLRTPGSAKSVEPQKTTADLMDEAYERGKRVGWMNAVIAARSGARLIAPDTDQTHLHHFAAETVVKEVEAGARAAGVRFTEPQDSRKEQATEIIAGLYQTVDWLAEGVGGLSPPDGAIMLWNESSLKAERFLHAAGIKPPRARP